MISSPQENSKSQLKSQRRETGFPEPFCPHRNTTLPHPEADTSPNPTIEASMSHKLNSERRPNSIQNAFRRLNEQHLFKERTLSNNEAFDKSKYASEEIWTDALFSKKLMKVL
ncbi:hypothetical protein OnM2_047036 [Erysiphe neolycopersici]|uniref:Uncharacterized protein n=1 Tax=Erysiphe neolycopersici TaxID=212602 RepID=A0A420HTQ5_9PEZI|nr:hypothetical protein OnM2_047036 [Erysiphe neolycopersici]